MRSNLSDVIEDYLLAQLMRHGVTRIEIQRIAVARNFDCAPSQVTYVLATRFTRARGFVVESKRGGGGFVRITRLVSPGQLLRDIVRATEGGITQADADGLMHWLEREMVIGSRDASLIRAAIDRETLALPLSECQVLRGRLLRAMIFALLADHGMLGEKPIAGTALALTGRE